MRFYISGIVLVIALFYLSSVVSAVLRHLNVISERLDTISERLGDIAIQLAPLEELDRSLSDIELNTGLLQKEIHEYMCYYIYPAGHTSPPVLGAEEEKKENIVTLS